MRESDGGAQPHYLYLVNDYSLLHSNDSTGHGIPSATFSGPQSLLFHARGMGFCVLSVIACDAGGLHPHWKVFLFMFNWACTSPCSFIMLRR